MATKTKRVLTLGHLGTHRGGTQISEGITPELARHIRKYSAFDLRPGRAAAVAAGLKSQFPWISTSAHVADGVDALGSLPKDAIVIGSMDRISDMIDANTQRDGRTLLLQAVGRLPGSMGAGQLGVATYISDGSSEQQADLLLRGFESFLDRASTSSRALTDGNDPVTAALLGPLRAATSAQTVRYLEQLARPMFDTPEPSLLLFTAADRHPLVVSPAGPETFRVRSEMSRELVSGLLGRRAGATAAVAYVSVGDALIDLHIVARGRNDERTVIGVEELRKPAPGSSIPAVVTD